MASERYARWALTRAGCRPRAERLAGGVWLVRTVLPGGGRGPEEGLATVSPVDRNGQVGRSDSCLCRHHHAAQKAPVSGTVCGREAEGRLATASLPTVSGEHPGSQGTLGRRT